MICSTKNNCGNHSRFRHEYSFFRNRLAGKSIPMRRTRAGREIQVATCPELIEELAEKLGTRLHFSAEHVAETLADYLGFLRVVQIPKVLDAVPGDPEDNIDTNHGKIQM
jgi:hypothetical protein